MRFVHIRFPTAQRSSVQCTRSHRSYWRDRSNRPLRCGLLRSLARCISICSCPIPAPAEGTHIDVRCLICPVVIMATPLTSPFVCRSHGSHWPQWCHRPNRCGLLHSLAVSICSCPILTPASGSYIDARCLICPGLLWQLSSQLLLFAGPTGATGLPGATGRTGVASCIRFPSPYVFAQSPTPATLWLGALHVRCLPWPHSSQLLLFAGPTGPTGLPGATGPTGVASCLSFPSPNVFAHPHSRSRLLH